MKSLLDEKKVDLVYLWVDGNDPEFIKSRNYWEGKLNIPISESNNDHKYIDNEELRYSLRSVIKNAPWINQIFIVTNGQIPKWLNLNEENRQKIKIIDHKTIMPANALPTFNSNAIESCIVNIPGLSEHFILANDDCFIKRLVKPSFFFDKKGKPIIRMLKQTANKKLLRKYLYHRNIRQSINIFGKKYNKKIFLCPQHNMDAYTKTYYLECINEFKDEFNNVIYQKFRGKGIQRILISLYMYSQKKCKLIKIKKTNNFGHKDSLYTGISSGAKMLDLINKTTPILLCLNDSISVKTEHIIKYQSFLEFLFPEKTIFEKEENNTKIYNNVISLLKEKEKNYNIQWKINNYISKIIKPLVEIKKDNGYKKYKIFGFIKINIQTETNLKRINKNYKSILLRLGKKLTNKQPIKVVFIVTENAKWAYQSVYDEFAKSKEFEPLVLVSILNTVHNKKDTTRESIESNYDFFKSKGLNVKYMYKDDKYIDLKTFKPDIIFYEQPWGLNKEFTPAIVSKYALCCYVPYSYMVIRYSQAYNQTFHKYLFKFFIENSILLKDYDKLKKGNRKNCVVTGYPKLDVYLNSNPTNQNFWWKDSDKFKIIYAPHHSMDNVLQLSTFAQNGKYILEWAKNHPETTFIFKPHPRLKFALLNCHLMTQKEVDEYFAEWETIGKVYTQGDYFGIFKTSDLMLTDCVSFLAEYLPSKKPLIRLVSKKGIQLNALGKKIVSEYYEAHNNEELSILLDEIALKQNDYNKEKRENLVEKIFDFNKHSATKIYNHLLKNIKSHTNQKEFTNKPKVSVILPIYNVGSYLREALDSLINQTLKDIEIICVDDCSQDNSYEIALEYAQKDSRIKVLHQEVNQGEVVAKHCGAMVARADYIGTLDPDDILEPNTYKILYKKITQTKSDIALCNYKYIENDKTFIKYRDVYSNKNRKNDVEFISPENINKINTGTTNKLIKKELYLNALNFKYRDIWKDFYQFWRLVTPKKLKIVFVNNYFYNYRQRTDSITHIADLSLEEKYKDFVKTIDLIVPYLQENGSFEGYKSALKEKITKYYKRLPKEIKNKEDFYAIADKYNISIEDITDFKNKPVGEKKNNEQENLIVNNETLKDICPHNAIIFIKGTSGNLEPVIFPERCNNCSICKFKNI